MPETTYAGPKRILDADSHIMELPDWLAEYADAKTKELLKPLSLGKAGAMAERAVAAAAERRRSGEALDDVTASRDLMGLKGWSAHGAFDASERRRAMDHLGFDARLRNLHHVNVSAEYVQGVQVGRTMSPTSTGK